MDAHVRHVTTTPNVVMIRLSVALRSHACAPNRLFEKLGETLRLALGPVRAPCMYQIQVLDKSYSSTPEKLLYGIGQGSCSSPIPWALLNQLLLAALGEEFDCIHLLSIDVSTDKT
jgi:hypothetical protein